MKESSPACGTAPSTPSPPTTPPLRREGQAPHPGAQRHGRAGDLLAVTLTALYHTGKDGATEIVRRMTVNRLYPGLSKDGWLWEMTRTSSSSTRTKKWTVDPSSCIQGAQHPFAGWKVKGG